MLSIQEMDILDDGGGSGGGIAGGILKPTCLVSNKHCSFWMYCVFPRGSTFPLKLPVWKERAKE